MDFLTLNGQAEKYDGRVGEAFSVIETDSSFFSTACLLRFFLNHRGSYTYLWIYPFHRNLKFILILARIVGIKTLLVLDGHKFIPDGCNKAVKFSKYFSTACVSALCDKIFYESSDLTKSFLRKKNLIRYGAALPNETVKKIRKLAKNTPIEKTILCPAAIRHYKGIDRLVNVFIKLLNENRINLSWKLKIIGKNDEPELLFKIQDSIKRSNYENNIVYESEKKGEEYYLEILKSSLVVSPTRKESFPNVFQDAYFSRRLFLTTKGAKNMYEMINDTTFFCENSDEGLSQSIELITCNIEAYNQKYDSLYENEYVIISDDLFNKHLAL